MPPRFAIKATGRGKAAVLAVLVAAAAGAYGVGPTAVPPEVILARNTLVRPWEGRERRAYYDTIARPAVWTICDGDTDNVKPGMVETPEGCDKRLDTRLTRDFYRGTVQDP